MSESVLAALPTPTPDPIFAIAQEAKAAGPRAIDGTVGVYLGEDGKPFVFPSVQKAIGDTGRALMERNYSYPPLTGLPEFREAVRELVFGETALPIAGIATTGGTGAVALNLRLAKMSQKEPSIIFPTPTWANHRQLCTEAGMRMIECPYVSGGKASIDGIVESLKKVPAPATILLHVGCHNPLGLDLSHEQWEELLPLISDHGAIALMDFAYQGFAATAEEDAWPVRRAAALGVTQLVSWSASKNHSLYSERVGLALTVAPHAAMQKTIEGHYMILTRKIHSASATFGQSVVARVQSHHRLEWEEDMKSARETMVEKRGALKRALPQEFSAALDGHGMFAVLPLTPEQIDRLKTELKVFLTRDGRINIAGIPLKRIGELAQKIARVL